MSCQSRMGRVMKAMHQRRRGDREREREREKKLLWKRCNVSDHFACHRDELRS